MKYSIVLAALSAAAIATPYVNVEVSEEAAVANSNNNHHHHSVDRQHGHRRGRSHGRNNNGGWFSSLWGNNGHDRSRNGRSHSRGRNGRSHSRNRRNNDRRSRSRGRFEVDSILDGILGSHYECILNGRTNSDERKDTERCCQENGGELYAQQGHCVFRDVLRNPRDDWRDCAMQQHGAEFAECYHREAREIEDELDGRGEDSERNRHHRDHRNHRNHRNSQSKSRDRHHRDHHRDNHHGRDHRMEAEDQTVLNGGRRHHRNNRRERYECRIELSEDQDRREQITRDCCNNEAEGRFDDFDRTCIVNDQDNRERFEQCARAQGAEDAQCRRD